MNATHATTGLAAALTIGLFGIVESAQAHQCTLADAAGRFGYTSTANGAACRALTALARLDTASAPCRGIP